MLKRATSKLTHNPTLTALRGTNQDLRLLQNLILAEKTLLLTLQKLSVDYAKASDALRAWSLCEGDDLNGILTASTVLLSHFSAALSQYVEHGHSIRRQLKTIRTRAESLENLKRNKHEAKRKAENFDRHMRNMSPRNKNFAAHTEVLSNLWKDVREMDFEIKLEEAAFGDFKRTATKVWMGLKFGGLVECCEKGMIAGQFGKLIIAEIPEGMTQPGLPRNIRYRRGQVEGCVADAHRGVSGVTLSTVPFEAFRDKNEYVQRLSEPHSSDLPAFLISGPLNNNGPRLSIESQLPPISNDHPGESQPPLTSMADNASYLRAIPPSTLGDYVTPQTSFHDLPGESHLFPTSNNGHSIHGELLQPPIGLDADNASYLRAIQPSSLRSHIPPQPGPFNNGPSLLGESQLPPISRSIQGGIQPPLTAVRLNADNAQPNPIQPSSLRDEPPRSILVSNQGVVAPPTLPSSQQLKVVEGSKDKAVPEASSNTAAAKDPTPPVPVVVPRIRVPGKFGGSKPDPFSLRAQYPVVVKAPAPPPPPVVEPKGGLLSRFFRAMWNI